MENFRKGCPSVKNDVQCAGWKKKEIESWLNENSKFKILVTGKESTGKHTLVAGVQKETIPEHDINFLFFDIPGANDSGDLSYINNMVSKDDEPDMVIFTVRMDNPVLSEDNKDAIESISHAFGWRVWKNTMFALTYANNVYKPGVPKESRENKVHFNKVKRNLSYSITKTLRDCRVQENIANDIPVVPTGRGYEPQIQSSADTVSWMDRFWLAVNKILKESREQSS